MRRRAGFTLIELMICIVLLELVLMHVPEVMRHVWRSEAQSGVSLDALARRELLARTIRLDLDRAVDAAAGPHEVAMRFADGSGVRWRELEGSLRREDGGDPRVFAGARLLPGTALVARPRGRLFTFAVAVLGQQRQRGLEVRLTRLLPPGGLR